MDLIDKEQALGCFWNYGYTDGTGYDETEMPAYYRLQALPPVAEVEDCISRQAAVDALMEILDRPNHAEFLYTDEVCKTLNDLPSAQPECTRECMPMYADVSDCISRRAAIDGKITVIISGQAIEAIPVSYIKKLPPAQPEIIHCCECKYWKPGFITDDDDFVPPSCAVGWVSGVWRATDYCSNAERRQNE